MEPLLQHMGNDCWFCFEYVCLSMRHYKW